MDPEGRVAITVLNDSLTNHVEEDRLVHSSSFDHHGQMSLKKKQKCRVKNIVQPNRSFRTT